MITVHCVHCALFPSKSTRWMAATGEKTPPQYRAARVTYFLRNILFLVEMTQSPPPRRSLLNWTFLGKCVLKYYNFLCSCGKTFQLDECVCIQTLERLSKKSVFKCFMEITTPELTILDSVWLASFPNLTFRLENQTRPDARHVQRHMCFCSLLTTLGLY